MQCTIQRLQQQRPRPSLKVLNDFKEHCIDPETGYVRKCVIYLRKGMFKDEGVVCPCDELIEVKMPVVVTSTEVDGDTLRLTYFTTDWSLNMIFKALAQAVGKVSPNICVIHRDAIRRSCIPFVTTEMCAISVYIRCKLRSDTRGIVLDVRYASARRKVGRIGLSVVE